MFFQNRLSMLSDQVVLLSPQKEPLPFLLNTHANIYALITRHLCPQSARHERVLRALAEDLGIQTVAGFETLFHDTARKPLQDVMTCIRHHTTVQQAGTKTKPNEDFALLSEFELRKRFGDTKEDVDRVYEVASQCTFTLDELSYHYPEENLPAGESEQSWLKKLSYQGARWRYGELNTPTCY